MRAARIASPLSPACSPSALSLAGCGGSGLDRLDLGGDSRRKPARRRRRATSRAAEGRTLREVLKAADGPAELVVSPAAMVFYKGENRYPFGVFERDRTQVPDAEVALYFAKVPTPKPGARVEVGQQGRRRAKAAAAGARPAGDRPLPGRDRKPRHPARLPRPDDQRRPRRGDASSTRPSSTSPATASGGSRPLIKEGDEAQRRRCCRAPSSASSSGSRRPGEKAPLIHTPTAEDVGGDLSKITTRIPPDTQNQVDYADALGKEPIVLLFATPQFCQSRVCGPVVDVAEQVKAGIRRRGGLHPHGDLQRQRPEQGRAPAGARLPPAERAVAVRDRPRGRDQRGDRGRLRRRTH